MIFIIKDSKDNVNIYTKIVISTLDWFKNNYKNNKN